MLQSARRCLVDDIVMISRYNHRIMESYDGMG